jgi:hypothetical protein
MRKLLVAALSAALLMAALPAQASGTLRTRVAKLEAKMACLKRTPMSSYLGYAWYESDGSVHVLTDTTNFSDSFSAAEFAQALGDTDPPAYWVVVVRNTSTCRGKFGIVANPFAARAVSRAGEMMRMHRLDRIQ